MLTSQTPKPSALVVEWQMRLEDLRAQLRIQGDHPKAWQWRMEAKVLVFMLARYSELAALNPLPTSPTLFIAKSALVGQVKERLSLLKRRQLLNDIEDKNWGKFRPGGAMDDYLRRVDASIERQMSREREWRVARQNEIDEKRERRRKGR